MDLFAMAEQLDGSEQQCADPRSTQARVVRGGSWDCGPAVARSAARGATVPSSAFGSLGFRVLCSSPIE